MPGAVSFLSTGSVFDGQLMEVEREGRHFAFSGAGRLKQPLARESAFCRDVLVGVGRDVCKEPRVERLLFMLGPFFA